ncbi:protein UPSTREAM OF FLC [Eucalyptus grandis]|uniref:protein UPSTREAM OF FLC n=1 Tax=Eucalyptus grandis TaxID=71139 RepID=UPI000526E44F|nr:protein UPSTREAM OF FLC [Eucalyptus grandis]
MKIGETECAIFAAAEMQRELETITGEVRRIKVLYFHRHGCGTGGGVEQPHLFCAYHGSSNDLLFKDIKRWLADLRGSHLTWAFSWSYKRRYKMGYIWQDVLDDDLLMPISLSVYPSWIESCLCDDEASTGNNVSSSREEVRDKYPHSSQTESPTLLQQCPLPSSDTSTLTIIKSVHLEDDGKHSGVSEPNNHSHCNISFKFGLLRKKNMENCERITGGMARTPVSSVSTLSSAQTPLTESKRRYKGTSQKFRNLITCGATDTNDAVLVMID